jgi:hypothetical protein
MFHARHLSTSKITALSHHVAGLKEASSTTRVVWLTLFALWIEIYAPNYFEDAFEASIALILLDTLCGWIRSILKSGTWMVTASVFNVISLIIHPSINVYAPSDLFLARDCNFGWSVGVALVLFTWRDQLQKWTRIISWILYNLFDAFVAPTLTPSYIQPPSSPTFRSTPRRKFPPTNESRANLDPIKSIYSNKPSPSAARQPLTKGAFWPS